MQKRSAETRSLILTVALDLFSRTGYEATSVSEICQTAGVSKGAFYHHFPTKQAVFMELLETWLKLLEEQLKSIQKESENIPDAILKMANLLEQVFQQASGRLPMFLEFWTQASHDPVVWKALIAPYHRYQEYFTELIAAGVAEGSFKGKDPEAAATALVAMGVGLLLMGVLDPNDESQSRMPTECIKILLDGLEMEKE